MDEHCRMAGWAHDRTCRRSLRSRGSCAFRAALQPTRRLGRCAPSRRAGCGRRRMTWTAPEVERARPPRTGDERDSLEGFLDYHRDTLLMKCAGLAADELKRASVEPSGLTLLGL